MSEAHFGSGYSGTGPENYQRYFVPVIGAPVAENLIEAAALTPGEGVLDVACGTGVVARLAAARVGAAGTVAGLDLNPGMLAVARAVTPAGVQITWHEGSAEAMPLPDAAFDVVLCQMGLQFIRDRGAALREMRRVLAPGGRLVLTVPGPIPQLFVIMAEALGRHLGPEAAGFVRQVFSLHDEAELERLLSEAGWRDVSVRPVIRRLTLPPPDEFFRQYVASTPIGGVLAQLGGERAASLEREVGARWRGLADSGDLSIDIRMLVGTARN